MIFRMLLPALLPLPLCAQAPATSSPTPAPTSPAVHIILQADPPPAGGPVLDIALISNALKAFATEKHLGRPVPNGNGWVLGVRLTTQQKPEGLLFAVGTMRLSHLKAGVIEQGGAKEDLAAAAAWEAPQLSVALSRELVRRTQFLLSQVDVVPPPEPIQNHKAPVVVSEAGGPVLEMDFPKDSLAFTPSQPPYPRDANGKRVQGNVVLQITVNILGRTESVTPLEGAGPLLSYAMEWAMRLRFKPFEANSKPIKARFPFHMNFRAR